MGEGATWSDDEGKDMIIGIAGGIGAGKSVVTDYLRGIGHEVIDADEIARDAVMPGEPALAYLTEDFGPDILNEDGTLNRARLASLAFADDAKVRRLNEILHKDIESRIMDHLRELDDSRCDCAGKGQVNKDVIFLSAPLLFESGLDRLCDEVWLVTAPENVRIERAVLRGGLTREEARARASRQISEEKRKSRSGIIIENVGDINELYHAVDRLLSKRVSDLV
jgi:dephospho-CoA kinase